MPTEPFATAACSRADFHAAMSMTCQECGYQPGPTTAAQHPKPILDEVLGDGTNYAVQRGILADFEARTAIRPRTTTAIRDGSPGLQIITEVHLTWDEFVSLVSRDA